LRAQLLGFGDGGGQMFAMIVTVGNDADFHGGVILPNFQIQEIQ